MKSTLPDPTIDVLIDPSRWIRDPAYRTRMLERPTPPHVWRFVCRDPEGGVQIVACVAFMHDGRPRTVRAPLKDVKR